MNLRSCLSSSYNSLPSLYSLSLLSIGAVSISELTRALASSGLTGAVWGFELTGTVSGSELTGAVASTRISYINCV